MEQIAIRTDQLTKQFGDRIAVNKLNLEIRKGEIFSLLGTNGAGKSTTIKMLCCLFSPTSGDAFLNGHQLSSNQQDIKKIIGVSPQESAIAEHLTSKENLLLMGGVFGLSSEENKKRALNLMDLLEIEDRKDQAKKLSGGLQRRLSIAMALMSDPEILFLDEPTLGLDPHSRKSVWNYIEKLKGHKTILLTTHYLEEADSLADHIAIMESGTIIANGTSSELKELCDKERIMTIKGTGFTTELVNYCSQNFGTTSLYQNELTIRSTQFDIYGITDYMKSNQIQLKHISMTEPTLDDVFLQLTGKERLS
ncbi:MAG: Abca4 [Bacteroidetes bacterium]|nr:Abca4 [Bacteroidota bacterium]